MPCTSERINMENKNTDWANALAEVENADLAVAAASAFLSTSCTVAIVTGGLGGGVCATAVTAYVWRVSEGLTAHKKSRIAQNAALQAIADYGTCLAKLNRSSE